MSIAEPIALGRERLLCEAEKLFAEHGYAAVSIRDITQATGMSAGAMYHHFGSKEDLFFELLEVNLREVNRTMRDAISQAVTAREQVRRVCEFYFSRPAEKRKLFEQVFRDLPRMHAEPAQSFTMQVREEYFAILEDMLREGMARGAVAPVNPRLAAVALHGMLRLVSNEALTGKHLSVETRVEFALHLFFDGIGAHNRLSEPVQGKR